jgi:hypothetical protein
MNFDWKSTLSAVAPLIGGSLAGPMGAAGVKLALSAFGIEPADNPADNEVMLEQKIANATPAEMLALKKADQDFKAQMKQLDIDIIKISQVDRGNARAREIAVGGKTTPLMAWFIVAVGFSFLAVILFQPVVVDKILLGTIIGLIIGEMRQVTAYYYGSSSGQDYRPSNDK